MKRYEKYKPSGVEWIGEIPKHWNIKPIKYLLKPGKEGIRIGPFGSSLKSEFLSLSGYKVYGQENVINNDFNLGWRYINDDKFSELSDYEITPGDVLVTMMGTTGKCKVVPKCIEKGIMDSHLIRMRIDDTQFESQLFADLINESNYVFNQMKMLSKGSIMEGLNSSIIKSILLIIPFPEEQTVIANYLDEKTAQIDSLIQKKQKLIELLKEERTAIINQAVTKGINPKVKLKPSGIEWLEEIPAHWEVKKLKYVAEINSTSLTEKEDDDLEIEYIDISSVNEDGDISQTAFYLYSDAPSRARRIIREGDTIISTVRTYLKAIAFIDFEKNNLICSTGFAVIRPSDKLEPKFLFYLSRSEKMVDRIMALSKGVSYPAIDSDDIKNLVGWFPDKDEQQAIVHHIETHTTRIDATISKIEKEIDLLQEYRTALISEVVTGKICVL